MCHIPLVPLVKQELLSDWPPSSVILPPTQLVSGRLFSSFNLTYRGIHTDTQRCPNSEGANVGKEERRRKWLRPL
jgi:hypothetical protein